MIFPRKIWVVIRILFILCLLLMVYILVYAFKDMPNVKSRTSHKIKLPKIASLFQRDINISSIIATQCQGHVTIYNHVMVLFMNVTLDNEYANAAAKGGVTIKNIMLQNESSEWFTIKRGLLSFPCVNSSIDLTDENLQDLNAHIKQWRDSIVLIKDKETLIHSKGNQVGNHHLEGLTIMIERNEYANVYWTMMDMYDVFIEMRFLNFTAKNTNIILADAHPKGHLDDLWHRFKSATRLQHIQNPLFIEKLSWRFDRKNSPFLNQNLKELPLIDEFRDFVVGTSDNNSTSAMTSQRDQCLKLKVLLIWRHDYVAHPRHPSGRVARKISNEDELLTKLRIEFPQHVIQGAQLDSYDVTRQVSLIANNDVIVGMHGAAMSFSVLLPRGGAVIELFPHYYGKPNWHMAKVATGSHHGYFTGTLSKKHDNTTEQSTYVPIDTATKLLTKALKHVCTERTRKAE